MKISPTLVNHVLETDEDMEDILFMKEKEPNFRFHGFDDGVPVSSRRGKTSRQDKRRERRLIRAARHGELEPKSFTHSSADDE